MNHDDLLSKLSDTAIGLQQAIETAKAPARAASALVPTKAKLRLVEAAAAIRVEPPALRPVLFLSTFLIQCTLPHSDPGDLPIWKRANGDFQLAIQPGYDLQNDRSLGFPYGTLPRLLLIWIVTEAKRTGCRRLELGNSLTEFLRTLGLDPHSRGKRSDALRLKDAARRLFGANIMFYRKLNAGSATGERLEEAKVAPKRELWWDVGPSDQAVLWGSWIELGEDFFAAIMASVVPCNLRAIRALRRSPLALDLYMLCNWLGANLAERGKKEHWISWPMLAQQLGGDYADSDNLKKKIKKQMRKVKLVHPELKVGFCNRRGGIVVKPSAPAIPRRLATAAR